MNAKDQDMDACPFLSPLAEVFEVEPSNVLVKTEELLLQLRGDEIVSLLSALNGFTTIGELFAMHGFSRTQDVLKHLQQSGLVLWAKGHEARYSPIERHNTLGGIHLADPFYVGTRRLEEALGDRGSFDGMGRRLQIVFTDSYTRIELRKEAERAAQSGDPWVLLKPGAATVWLGPVFQAEDVPCWDCFVRRLVSQDDSLALILKGRYKRLYLKRPSTATQELFTREAASATSTQIKKYLSSTGDDLKKGELIQIDVERGSSLKHRVVAYPGCARCGTAFVPDSFRQSKTFLEAQNRKTSGGLWGEIKERVGHLIDPVTGIVAELGVCNADSDEVVRVAVASYADPTGGELCKFALDESSGRIKRSHLVPRTAFGGGHSDNDARARSVLEAFERYCGIFQGTESTVLASLNELGEEAFHPNSLMNYSAEQLKQPNCSLKGAPRELRVPKSFDENVRIHWTLVESLSGSQRYAPTAYCYDCFNEQPDKSYCTYDTNGSAIAFTIEDAIVRGFLEVVERDAVSIWWYNRVARPVVEINTFSDEFVARIAEQHDHLERQLTVFDITNDLNTSVFAAMSVGFGEPPILGFGAHFNARRALKCALTELGQALCFIGEENEKWGSFAWSGQPHLTRKDAGVRGAADYTDHSVNPTVRNCMDVAAAAGLEIFVLDCTRADIGLPAVRIIVPGLRHFWPRFGTGRLWDVPVKLGWLDEPTAPSEINPEYLRS
jgi:ribosomal protein S12 methylthiotransferase accessory factor